jgi:L-2,4-diaminobutyrate decarboxylase
VAAAGLVAATNQSLDSWDQAPLATHLERRLVAGLAARAGFDPEVAGGVMTSGGTQSNLMRLLLARDDAAARSGRDVAADGLGPDAGRYRILCSELAHFSVARAAAVLGLGGRAVQPVPVDRERRLRPEELDRALHRMEAAGELPLALVATAGTTDFGSIDPLPALAERARARGCGCTSTPPGAAGCCSATATATCWPGSRRPTRWRSTSTSCSGSRPAAAPSWSATGPTWPRWR